MKSARECKGSGVARRCEAAGGLKMDFAMYIMDLWEKIGYTPSAELLDLQEEDYDISQQIGGQFTPSKPDSLPHEFAGVCIKQFPQEIDQGEIVEYLIESGFPE